MSGLSDRHIQILRYLSENPGSTIAAIQRGVALSLARRYVNELQGEGMILWKRQHKLTNRVKRWYLSPQGESFMESLMTGSNQPKKSSEV